jgi:hypothetical protein
MEALKGKDESMTLLEVMQALGLHVLLQTAKLYPCLCPTFPTDSKAGLGGLNSPIFLLSCGESTAFLCRNHERRVGKKESTDLGVCLGL